MTTYRRRIEEQADRDFMERVERLDITDYVQTFLLAFRKKNGIAIKMNYQGGAEYLKSLLNAPENKICPTLESLNGFFYWNTQKVNFVPSNLRRGYLFYFVCVYCDRRVKYLYRYRMYEQPACRMCCKLGYVPTQSKRLTRNLSRLIHKPYLHSEDKYQLAKWAGITSEDLQNG